MVHVYLLSSRNLAFVKLLTQMIRLRAQFPDYPIKTILLDNAGEFTSQDFDVYCVSVGIKVEHPVAQFILKMALLSHLLSAYN